MADSSESPVAKQRRKADHAWQQNSVWDRFYADAYDYAIPFRRPGGLGKRKDVADRLFDMTAPVSAMTVAGELQNKLFAGAPVLETGALVAQAIGPKGKEKLDRELERTGAFIYPFMQAGEFETATHEMCIDLGVGTGALIPMRGTPEQPIIFYAVPADEIAIAGDAYGRMSLASWKRSATREQILEAFPKGKFRDEFKRLGTTRPNDEFTLYQDFYRLPDGRWRFCAYLEKDCDDFIAEETTLTQPIAVPTYYRVPGEIRGRGPILLAMPSIKTVNKAQELALRAAAIQMLGIWAYRAGGTFNPDTVRVEAGQFWPMQSTGGILGPDVQRLDPASGRLDIGRMVIEGMQQQIRDGLMDPRLPPQSGTPRSASEIASTVRQNARVHLNGFARLWRGVHPIIVPRSAEILHSFGYLRGLMNFNQLITAVSLRSPITSQMRADELQNLAQYIELLIATFGPQKLDEFVFADEAADQMGDALSIPKRMIPDADAKAGIRDQKAKAMAEMQAAAMAEKAAPQLVDAGLQVIQGGKVAA